MQELDGVREVYRNLNWYIFFAVILFVTVIRTPHGDPLLAGFVVLKREEAKLIKRYKISYVIVHYYIVGK